jgi:hypothetical protein
LPAALKRTGETAGEADARGVRWDNPHCPPTGFTVVELERLFVAAEIMKGFFHRVRKLGRLVGRYMSPVQDENSKGVNTSGWTTIRALHDQTVVLRAQGEGGEQGVIGVLYLSMLVRSTRPAEWLGSHRQWHVHVAQPHVGSRWYHWRVASRWSCKPLGKQDANATKRSMMRPAARGCSRCAGQLGLRIRPIA